MTSAGSRPELSLACGAENGRLHRLRIQSQCIVLASVATLSFFIGGVGSVAVGLFIAPWMSEFGWPNGLTSSVATAFNLTALLAAPAVGFALDRFAPTFTMLAGVLAAAAGFWWAGHCHTHHGMLAAFMLVGVGYCASFNVSCPVVATKRMESKRNLGMGIVYCATSLGAAAFSPLIGWGLDRYGWRATMDLLAIVVALMFPVVLLIARHRPSLQIQAVDAVPLAARTPSLSRDWLQSSTFMLVTSLSALFAIGMGCIYYHVVPLLMTTGYSASSAGLVFGISWLLTAPGSLAFGVMADHLGVRAVLPGALLCCAAGTLFLLGTEDKTVSMACVVAFVILWGAPATCVYQFVPIIFAEEFGCRNLGSLIGVQSVIAGIAGAAAPVWTGLLYDHFNTYRLPICLSVVALFIACCLALLLKAAVRPRMPEILTR